MTALLSWFKKSKNTTLKTYEAFYLTVDECPIYNWNKVFTDGEFLYLYREPKGKELTIELLEVSDMLMDSFIKRFGFTKKVKRYNQLRFELVRLKIQYIKTSDRLLVNRITQLEDELEQHKKLIFSQGTSEFDKNHVILQKWYGQPIPLKTTTVNEYYSILEVYERANKKNGHSGGRGSR
jgi:hypothetical protein